jgi:hypothetical protein
LAVRTNDRIGHAPSGTGRAAPLGALARDGLGDTPRPDRRLAARPYRRRRDPDAGRGLPRHGAARGLHRLRRRRVPRVADGASRRHCASVGPGSRDADALCRDGRRLERDRDRSRCMRRGNCRPAGERKRANHQCGRNHIGADSARLCLRPDLSNAWQPGPRRPQRGGDTRVSSRTRSCHPRFCDPDADLPAADRRRLDAAGAHRVRELPARRHRTRRSGEFGSPHVGTGNR